ncbi:DsbC family protein [Aquabacterium sp. J223]|uniref:DsbC family protein n=1 Tax=Aquabacterium sp. J223 TaxID=2898431 RepID=UPI0021AD509B|nr:DsbC family protein [Aquabacterium sp. J223]UUX96758.1 DsbC family protein [Aquabacterium sp. J223]
MSFRLARRPLLAAAFAVLALPAVAQEAAIRKNLADVLPKIDEVVRTPVPGLWEIRIGQDVLYTDEQGRYVMQGQITDVRSRRNLTQERLDKLSAIDFASLSPKDAVVWKTGNGKRKLAVFADPNCGYCKRFERSLSDLKDATVYTYIIPILGPDSAEKSKAIWCAKDSTAAWRGWMLDQASPPKPMGQCDTAALDRNLAFARKHRITGTPSIFFEDGSRIPGAVPMEQVEQKLQDVSKG